MAKIPRPEWLKKAAAEVKEYKAAKKLKKMAKKVAYKDDGDHEYR